MDYKEIKKRAESLLKQVESDKYKEYDFNWKSEVVSVLNEYNYEENPDDIIYDLNSDEWEEIVKMNLEQRGWIGVKILLEDVDNNADYGRLDAYGNGKSCDYDLLEDLKDLIEELGDKES